ncbi:MAG: coenzyme synthesis protein [Anaerocolumna sp.]|nr:coenzyme synthesis protein [Anaerocolumna sp.]
MKIKNGFLLREIADVWVVVPLGERVIEFNGLVNLSESGALIWRALEKEVKDKLELVNLIRENYEVDEENAGKDLEEFLQGITEKGFLDYD